MEIVLLPKAEEDLNYWKQVGDKRIMKRISSLLADIIEHPFSGIGKPEPLKGEQHGLWSRRITDEHRLVYSISSGKIYVYVLSLRYHYSKK
ncbi:MAG: Txe/YoeB family addiction module toxin [Bacteroidales bacterium]|nr:Txe/YoeB family addiction module toxin [Bacteroidales bacterium]